MKVMHFSTASVPLYVFFSFPDIDWWDDGLTSQPMNRRYTGSGAVLDN